MPLGKGDRVNTAQHERFKATPSGYPGEGPVTIEHAYTELTRAGFSVWVRIMVMNEGELKRGRVHLARALGYSETRCAAVFRELRRKGYVRWITTPGYPSELVILRRAKIRSKNHFVRISRQLSINNDEETENRIFYPHLTSAKIRQLFLKEIPTAAFCSHRAYVLLTPRLRFAHTATVLFTHTPENTQSNLDLQGSDLHTLRSAFMQNEKLQKPVKRRKFVHENGYVTKSGPVLKGATYKERIANRVLIERQRRERVRSEAKRSEVHGRRVTKIDFGKLDQRGDPAISFDPDSPLREQMVEILSRPPKDPARKRLMEKLGTEFGRIYTRYRRQAESMYGLPMSPLSYEIPDREKHYACEAGMWCVIKGVTPRRLLEYWHKNIKTFASKTMKIPPLSLMRSPGMVDQVACASLDPEPSEPSKEKPNKKHDPRPGSRNSFSDDGALDIRLRRGLERAGFDTQDYSDRYLMTIQQLAIGVSKGQEVFVSSKQQPMVIWVSKNLYNA